MAVITRYTCDICENAATQLKQKVPVVFVTEQTEGRSCKPHLTMGTIDLCKVCMERIIESYPLIGYGAQGSNTYEWRKK